MPDPAADLESAVLTVLEPLAGRPSAGQAARGKKYPQLSLGRTTIHDWSSGAETGEQLFTVHVWSKAGDGAEAKALSAKVRARLAERFDLSEGRVARMRLEFEEIRYDAEQSVHHGLLRFRARIEDGARAG